MAVSARDALTIRRARRADVPAIIHLLADDPLGGEREQDVDPLPAAYYEAFAAIDADACNELVVVEALGEVIGTLQLTVLRDLTHLGGRRAHIEAVRVDRRWRGRRVGEALLRWAIDRARAAGCHLVQLTSNGQRHDAHRFYERLGFTASHVGFKLDLRTPEAHGVRATDRTPAPGRRRGSPG